MKNNKNQNTAPTSEVKAVVALDAATLEAISNSRFASLKSKELAKAGLELDAIGNDVAAKAVAQCKVYFDVTSRKLYEEDGFKNVGEFAEKYFGESKSSASQKATVYGRFFTDDASDVCKRVLELVGNKPAVLYELSKMTDDELQAELDKGTFDNGCTLDAAKALAKAAKAARDDGKTAVVKMFDFVGKVCAMPIEVTTADGNTERRDGIVYDMPAFDAPMNDSSILDGMGFADDDKLFKARFEDVTYYIGVNHVGNVVIATATERKPEKPEKLDVPAVKVNVIRRMNDKGIDVDDIADMVELEVDTVKRILGK
jgi:hypothetical protein